MSQAESNSGAASAAPPAHLHPASFPLPLDMTDLHKYERYVGELTLINSLNGAFYMQKLLEAKELASGLYAKVLFEHERAKSKAKEEQALAYLERSSEYIEKHNLKATDETKKQYVMIDPLYKAAREVEDYFAALVELLNGKVFKFNAAHDDARLIFQKSKDPYGSTTGAASGKDGQ